MTDNPNISDPPENVQDERVERKPQRLPGGFSGIITSHQFSKAYALSVDHHIEGVTEQGYVYTVTGPTGSGKTTVNLRLALHLATGASIGPHRVKRAPVLYIAAENPTDTQRKWLALLKHMGLDPADVPVDFHNGPFDLTHPSFGIDYLKVLPALKLKTYGTVIVDTSAAMFINADHLMHEEGRQTSKNENDNTQAGLWAAVLRRLTTLPGNPTVLVPAHPAKHGDMTMPRGGNALLNAVDGNLTVTKDGDLVRLHWAHKIRGPDFEPISFELRSVKGPHHRPDGTLMLNAAAEPMTDTQMAERREEDQDNTVKMRAVMFDDPGGSTRSWAKDVGLTPSAGYRALKALRKAKEAKSGKDGWHLTPEGRKAEKALRNPKQSGGENEE